MAIDYGDARTGVAVSDPTLTLCGFSSVVIAYRPEAVIERLKSEYAPFYRQVEVLRSAKENTELEALSASLLSSRWKPAGRT